MWKCDCGWSGESGDLKPVSIDTKIQGKVRSFVCPGCGGLVGDSVNIFDQSLAGAGEDITQEISDSGEEASGEEGGGGFRCPVPGCEHPPFKTKKGLDNHMEKHEPGPEE